MKYSLLSILIASALVTSCGPKKQEEVKIYYVPDVVAIPTYQINNLDTVYSDYYRSPIPGCTSQYF